MENSQQQMIASGVQLRFKGYDRIMANADEAMYLSKRTGKNRLTIYAGQPTATLSVFPGEGDTTA